eukprot:2326604-Rhodomonas_salina.1
MSCVRTHACDHCSTSSLKVPHQLLSLGLTLAASFRRDSEPSWTTCRWNAACGGRGVTRREAERISMRILDQQMTLCAAEQGEWVRLRARG